MKILVALLLSLLFFTLHAQDTLYLRGAYPVTGKVLEIDDDYVTLQKSTVHAAAKDKIKLAEVKLIKYKGGYVEKYKGDAKYTYLDRIQLIDARVISCIVMEVEETAGDSVLIDTENALNLIKVPFDSIASITYRTGTIDTYHEMITSQAGIVQPYLGGKENISPDSVRTSKFYNKLISYNNINDELKDAKGNFEDIKKLFDRVVSNEKYKGANYDSLISGIILEYCRLFDEVYFTGKKQDDIPVGKGELYKPGGEIQSGEFVNGKLNGPGKIIRNSVIEKEGQFSNGELNGQGTITDSRGRVIQGMFIDNQLSGQGSITFKNGAFEKGNYLKSRLSGEGERHLQNNNFYKGNFKSSKYDGYGVYQWHDQHVSYEGNFIEGKREGKGILKLPDGITITGEWKNDCPDGQVEIKQQQAQKSGDYYTATWLTKDCKIEAKTVTNGKIKFDENLLFIKMTGY